jgi:hypothetical protein
MSLSFIAGRACRCTTVLSELPPDRKVVFRLFTFWRDLVTSVASSAAQVMEVTAPVPSAGVRVLGLG